MDAQPDIGALIRQARRYEFSDGLVELQVGVVMIALGISSQLAFSPMYMRLTLSLSETFGAWAKWLTVSVVLLLACVALGTRHVIRYVRRHWLWRNTGFVKSLPSVVPRKVLILALAVVLVSTAIGFTLPRVGWVEPMFLLRMLAAGVGWAQGVSAVGVGRTTGLSRWIWLGISGGLVSTLFLFIHLAFGQTLPALCLLWGLAFAASGLVSVRCALRPKTYGRANNV